MQPCLFCRSQEDVQIGVWGLAHSNLQDYGGRRESGLARDLTTPGLADFDFSLTNVSPFSFNLSRDRNIVSNNLSQKSR